MPRQAKRERTRTDLRTNSATSVAHEINARPTDTYIEPPRKTGQLVEALSAISPSLGRLSQYHSDKQFREGQRAAELDNLPLEDLNKKIAAGEINREATPQFQDGYMQLHGLRQARELKSQLLADLQDPTKFNPETDNVDEFFHKYVDEAAEVDDESYQVGFMNGIEGTRDELANWHRDYQAKAIRTQVIDDYHAIVKDTLSDALANGENLTQADFAALKADAVDVFGLTKKEFEETAFAAAHAIGMQGVPEAYDIFYKKRNDGTPGLASTKQWSEKIEQARLQALSIKNSQKTEADQEAIFNANLELKELERDAANVLLPDYINKARGYVTDGTLKGSAASSRVESFITAKIKADHIQSMRDDIRSGLGVYHRDDADFNEAATPLIKDILDKANAAGNPQAGIAQAIELQLQNGFQYPPWKNLLEGAHPSNGKTFVQAAELMRTLKTNSPAYATTLVNEDQDVAFDVYWNMVQFGGADQSQALERVNEIGSAKFRAEANEMLRGEAGRKLLGKIQSEVLSRGLFKDDPENQIEATRKIRELTVLRMMPQDLSVEQAMDWAVTRYLGTHKFIDGRYVNPGPKPLYDGFEEDLATFKEQLPSLLESAGLPTDEEGYEIRPTGHTLQDGKWRIFYKSNGFPTGKTIDPDKMLKARSERIRQETVDANIKERTRAVNPITGNPEDHPIYGDMWKEWKKSVLPDTGAHGNTIINK